MAIINSAPGVIVTVRVNGKTATEYGNPYEEDIPGSKTVTKYIESIDDATFSIFVEAGKRYKWRHPKHLLRFTVTVDGKEMWRHVMGKRDAEHYCDIRGAQVCDVDGYWVQEEMKFSLIKIVDAGMKQQVFPDLGVIQVTVTRVSEIGARHPMPELSNTENEKPVKIAERSLKGYSASHGTIVVRANQISRPTCLPTFPIVRDGGPIATFRFVYTSREALKHNMIIPSSLPRTTIRSVKRETKTGPVVKKEIDAVLPVKREHSVEHGYNDVWDVTDDDSKSRDGKRVKYSSPIGLKYEAE